MRDNSQNVEYGADIIGPEMIEASEKQLAVYPDPDKRKFYVGMNSYSFRGLVDEIKNRTPVGIMHARIIENWKKEIGSYIRN